MGETAGRVNREHLYRHAKHALDDFPAMRKLRRIHRREELLHSISHHLRHVLYRSGLEVKTDAHR